MVFRGGDRLFAYLFETKKGRFSWSRSALATFVACLLLSLPKYGWMVLRRPEFYWSTLALMAVATLVPDALSLLETRWLVRRFVVKRRTVAWGVVFLVGDLVLTTGLIYASSPLIHVSYRVS